MRDFRLRRLERHRVGGTRDHMELSYPAPRSPSGKIYQYSPNPQAVPRLFLIGDASDDRQVPPEFHDHVRRNPGPGDTVCPYSGLIAADEEFTHLQDVEAIKKQIGWEATAAVQDYLADFAKDFNRRQPRNGLISMKLDVKPGHRRPKPVAIREDLLRDLECHVCQRAYGVYAIALFCPDCGAPNLVLHFQREETLIAEQVTLADSQNSAGQAELAYRLMGNAHEDVLTAFETTLKVVYRYLVRAHLPEQADTLCGKKAIGNKFQNIDRARQRFAVLGIDPFAQLTDADLAFLQINIQKRHVVGHNLGVADEHYAELVQEEQPGETVALLGEEIRRFVRICMEVVGGLETYLIPGARLPTTEPPDEHSGVKEG